MRIDFTFLSDKAILILGHWDADGICSTVKFRQYINKDAEYYTPPIGSYTVPMGEFSYLSGFDYIVVLDIAVRDDNLGDIADATDSDILVLDHHFHLSRENAIYIDPSMENGERFYSNTLLLDHLLEKDMDILTVLGLVGDLGMKIREKDIFIEASKVLEENRLSLEDVYKIVLLIDSNHIVNDRNAVKEAVEKISGYLDDPRMMLEDSDWLNRYEDAIAEINRLSSDDGLERGSKWIYKEFSSNYYIISRVGRRISSRYRGLVTIVVNKGFFPRHAQVYIRTNQFPLETYRLINYALSKGYVAGGKDTVMGAIVPKDDLDAFITLVKAFIEKGVVTGPD